MINLDTMTLLRKTGAVLVFYGLAILTSGAQPVNEYAFRILFMNSDAEVEGGLIELGVNLEFETHEEVFRVAAYAGKLTRYFRYVGVPELNFFQQTVDDEGNPLRSPVISVDLGVPGDKLIILMRTPSGELKAMVQDVSSGSLVLGDVRIMNFTRFEVAVRIGELVTKVGGMRSRDITPAIAKPRKMERLALAVMDGDMTRILENRRVLFRRDESKLILVHPDSRAADAMAYTMISIEPEPIPQDNVSDKAVELYDPNAPDRWAVEVDEYGMREYK
ncbi:MAG: hypothetical protein Q7Q73_05620 [Verrucomicrobiota bacterium JB024]|nr:hypothetical protein [Verrucomicrobiota bacterium JB024]